MSSQLTDFVSPITGPLNDLHGHLSRMAAMHREAYTRLSAQNAALTLIGGADVFIGDGAAMFSSAVDHYANSTEQHMQALDHAVATVNNCINDVMGAVDYASAVYLDEGIASYVILNLHLDEVILYGASEVANIIDTLRNRLDSAIQHGGDFLGHVFQGIVGGLVHGVSEVIGLAGQLASEVLNLLEDVGRVLSQWANDMSNAVTKCFHVISALVLPPAPYVTHVVESQHSTFSTLNQQSPRDKAIKTFLNDPTYLNMSRAISATEGSQSPITIIRTGPDTILVLLAGTDPGHPEWVTNLPIALDAGAGDKNNPYLLDINAAIEQFMQENNMPVGAKVTVAGHSLGGIEAQYLAENNGTTNYTVEQVITFGSPEVGPQLSGVNYQEYFNEFDPISLLSWYSISTGSGRSQEIPISGDPNMVLPKVQNVGDVLALPINVDGIPLEVVGLKDHDYRNYNATLDQQKVPIDPSKIGAIDYYDGTPQDQWVDWHRAASTLNSDVPISPSGLPSISIPINFLNPLNLHDCLLMPPGCML